MTYRAVRARIAAINAFLQEHISGMATVQLFNREAKEAEKFDGLNARHRDANIESVFYYAVFYPVIELIQTIGIALIVWYGGGQVIQGTLSVGALVAFFQYAQRFYEPISDLSEKYNILQAAMAASERVFKLLDTPVKIEDSGELEVGPFERIEFRNVWFAYNDEEWVLKNVSFSVNRGERVALVGHTGAGKTTVTALLLRFYEPQRGEILINGIDIRKYKLTSLRRLFAIVQQDFFLFTGDVARTSPSAIRRSARSVSVRRRARAGGPVHLPSARDVQGAGPRARRGILGGREAVAVVCASAGVRSAGADPRRSHVVDRHRDGAADPGSDRDAARRPDVDRHRAPALDDPLGRLDPRFPSRRDPRARHAR